MAMQVMKWVSDGGLAFDSRQAAEEQDLKDAIAKALCASQGNFTDFDVDDAVLALLLSFRLTPKDGLNGWIKIEESVAPEDLAEGVAVFVVWLDASDSYRVMAAKLDHNGDWYTEHDFLEPVPGPVLFYKPVTLPVDDRQPPPAYVGYINPKASTSCQFAGVDVPVITPGEFDQFDDDIPF